MHVAHYVARAASAFLKSAFLEYALLAAEFSHHRPPRGAPSRGAEARRNHFCVVLQRGTPFPRSSLEILERTVVATWQVMQER